MEKPGPRRFVENTDGRTDLQKAAVVRRVAAFNREFSADPQRQADLALVGRLYRQTARPNKARSAIGVYDGDVSIVGADLIHSANGYPVEASILAVARLRAGRILNPRVERPVTTGSGNGANGSESSGDAESELKKRIRRALDGDRG